MSEEFYNMYPTQRIDWFSGPYHFLSNFYEVQRNFGELILKPYALHVPWQNRTIEALTTEHLYQAAKTDDLYEADKILSVSTADAKALGQKVSLIENWDLLKFGVMETLIAEKFNLISHSREAFKLLDTGRADLVEGTTWNDRVWGVDLKSPGTPGKNWLGMLLMNQRARLRMQ